MADRATTPAPKHGKKVLYFAGLGIVILIIALALWARDLGFLTVSFYREPVDRAIVQVWDLSPDRRGGSPAMESTGVIINQNGLVLTVLNYEFSPLSNLEVVLADGSKYQAAIQAVDPRTSATLLKIEAEALPVARTSDATLMRDKQRVLVRSWCGPDTGVSHSGEPAYRKISARAYKSSDYPPLLFGITLEAPSYESYRMVGQGSMVTDGSGTLGMMGTVYMVLAPPSVPPGWLPPAVSINSALELLSPESAQKPWAKSPVCFSYLTANRASSYLRVPDNYEEVVTALNGLLTGLGAPVKDTEIQLKDLIASVRMGGTLLAAVYAQPISLRGMDGSILARARWIGIQWGGSQGNRLFYGQRPYYVDGGFILPGDVAPLEKAILRK